MIHGQTLHQPGLPVGDAVHVPRYGVGVGDVGVGQAFAPGVGALAAVVGHHGEQGRGGGQELRPQGLLAVMGILHQINVQQGGIHLLQQGLLGLRLHVGGKEHGTLPQLHPDLGGALVQVAGIRAFHPYIQHCLPQGEAVAVPVGQHRDFPRLRRLDGFFHMLRVILREADVQPGHLRRVGHGGKALQVVVVGMGVHHIVDFLHLQLLQHGRDPAGLLGAGAVDEHGLPAAAQERRVAVQNLREDDFQQHRVLRKGKALQCGRVGDGVHQNRLRFLPQPHAGRQQRHQKTNPNNRLAQHASSSLGGSAPPVCPVQIFEGKIPPVALDNSAYQWYNLKLHQYLYVLLAFSCACLLYTLCAQFASRNFSSTAATAWMLGRTMDKG